MTSRHGVGHVIRYGRFDKFSKRLSEKKGIHRKRERKNCFFFFWNLYYRVVHVHTMHYCSILYPSIYYNIMYVIVYVRKRV